MESLCLHSQMQAWQNLIPEKGHARNGEVFSTPLPDLPEGWEHMPHLLHQIGTAGAGFSGLIPLSWTDIASWIQLMQAELTSFEIKAIRAMSAAYTNIANDPKSDCPVERTEEEMQSANEKNVSAWIALAKKG